MLAIFEWICGWNFLVKFHSNDDKCCFFPLSSHTVFYHCKLYSLPFNPHAAIESHGSSSQATLGFLNMRFAVTETLVPFMIVALTCLRFHGIDAPRIFIWS